MSRNKTRTAPIGCGVMYAITLINDLIELSYTKIIVEIVTQTKKDYFFIQIYYLFSKWICKVQVFIRVFTALKFNVDIYFSIQVTLSQTSMSYIAQILYDTKRIKLYAGVFTIKFYAFDEYILKTENSEDLLYVL